MDDLILEKLGVAIIALCAAFLLSVVMALPVMLLWNNTLPDLFGIKEISWLTAWKLTMLVSFISPVRVVKSNS